MLRISEKKEWQRQNFLRYTQTQKIQLNKS